MDIIDGWLEGALRVESPNCDDRPDRDDISLVVVHGISLPPGEFGGSWIDRLFTNTLPEGVHPYFETVRHLRVSTHVLIGRDGTFKQYVPFHKRAWHAGTSVYRGRERCNDFSIGIELEGSDDCPYTDEQYLRLAEVVPALIREYPMLSRETLAGHSHIAPGRKTDPGPAFDWAKLRGLWPESAE
jgi:N-acetyl-anhydromuramoyl-L-alanine amidase